MAVALVDIIAVCIQLAIGLTLAYVSIYMGMWILKLVVFVRTKKVLNIRGNLKVGNNALAIVVASMAVGIAMVGEVGLSIMFKGGPFGVDYMMRILVGEAVVLIGILIGVFLIGITESIMSKTFKDINILDEIKDGNMALSIILSTLIIIICYFGRIAVVSLATLFGS